MAERSLHLKNILFCFLLVAAHALWAKDVRIDSLIRVIPLTEDDSTRLRFVNEVAFYYVFNDAEKAISMLDSGLYEAVAEKLAFCENELTNTKGIYFDVTGVRDSARHYLEKSLTLSRKHGFKSIERMALNGLGLNLWNTGQLEQALRNFTEALDVNRRHFPDNKESEANYLNNIGLIYQELRQYERAISYHETALAIRDSLGIAGPKAVSLANLGVCYKNTQSLQKAEKAYLEAIRLAQEADNMRMYFSLHDNLGNLYFEMQQYGKAVSYLKRALERETHIGKNPKSDLSTYSNLAAAYNALGNATEALTYASTGFSILQQNPDLRMFATTLYKSAAESNYMIGKRREGSTLLAEYIAISDSLFKQNHAKALADLEVKFKTEEQLAKLAKAEASLIQQQLRIENQNLLLYGGVFALVLVLAISYLLFRQQKLKTMQLLKDVELKDARNQIALQKKLNEQRQHIARELHDNIGTYLTFMKASLEKLPDTSGSARIKEVVDLMKKTAVELRHTVWILNHEQATLEDILLRVRNLLQISPETAMLSADVIGDDQLELTNIQSTHLIRVIQEAVNNALKHSGATQVDVLIYSKFPLAGFEVRDNGVGFNAANGHDGNGIGNMRYRLEKLGGSFSVTSDAKGTRVSGEFPVSDAVALQKYIP